MNLIRDEIKPAAEWDPDALLNREYETHLHEHYGRLLLGLPLALFEKGEP